MTFLAKLGEQTAVARREAKVAIQWDGKSLSYSALLASAATLAERFADAGIGPGSVLCASFDNEPAFIVTLLAANSLGATFAPIDVGLTVSEAAAFVRHCGCDLFAVGQDHVAAFSGFNGVKCVVGETGEVVSFSEPRTSTRSSDSDGALVLFSSGSTGKPKAIMISHDSLIYRSEYLRDAIGLTEVDRTLCTLPLSHTHGLECLAMPTLLAGGTLLLLPPRLAFPLYVIQELEAQKVTFFSSIPNFYDFAVKLPSTQTPDLSALRFPFCGSAALAKATAERFFEKYGVRIKQGYGLVELSVICLNTHDSEPIRFESVGRPIQGVEWRIADNSREGELQVRSRALFSGYLNDAQETAKKLHDGWMLTGDLVRIDDDGLFYIVGRLDDFIKVGGLKVYAAEVEAALISLVEIRECAVIAEKDELGSETIVAQVVPAPDQVLDGLEAKIIAGLRPLLVDYKLPRRVIFVSSLPKSRLGKIAKGRL